jgi:hypothetical protein
MDLTYSEIGYLGSTEYLAENYATPYVRGAGGLQFLAVITKDKTTALQTKNTITTEVGAGAQFRGFITDSMNGQGLQTTFAILSTHSAGLQTELVTAHVDSQGLQANGVIESGRDAQALDFLANPSRPLGGCLQFHSQIVDYSKGFPVAYNGQIDTGSGAGGLQFLVTTITHLDRGHLVERYLVDPYLVPYRAAVPGMQWESNPLIRNPGGLQFLARIGGWRHGATQFLARVDTSRAFGISTKGRIADSAPFSLQTKGEIKAVRMASLQFLAGLTKPVPMPVEFGVVNNASLGIQFRSVLYNTDNLRVLYSFPSRGNGSSWTASSVAPGDFAPSNLNTDVVEQVWRSAPGAKTGVLLNCDTGLPQGVYMDTLALLNHNLTTSAIVTLQGSPNPDFSGSDIFSTTMTIERENTYWIAPEMPQRGYRYWRITIDDFSNPSDYLQIGTLVFGEAAILQGESFSNPIRYRKVHFKDTVQTEGFTNVSNDRGVKKILSLDFNALNFNGGNYTTLTDLFMTCRTNLKALWIPTPKYASRYAVFGKLSELPQEEHTDNGKDADYVNLSLEVNEAN